MKDQINQAEQQMKLLRKQNSQSLANNNENIKRLKAKVTDLEKDVLVKQEEIGKLKQKAEKDKAEKKGLNTSGSNLAVKNITVDISEQIPVITMPLTVKKKSNPLTAATRGSSNGLGSQQTSRKKMFP